MSVRARGVNLPEEEQARIFPQLKAILERLDRLLKMVVGTDGHQHFLDLVGDLQSQVASPFCYVMRFAATAFNASTRSIGWSPMHQAHHLFDRMGAISQ